MAYEIIQPPFTLKFREMSEEELRDYNRWFLNVISQRVHELTDAVRSTRGFEAWKPDFSPLSLERLAEWFAMQVETRPRNSEEIAEIKARGKIPIDVPAVELTNKTFSLAVDLGMYLARMFLADHPKLEWKQPLDNPDSADYGQPVLVGFGPVAFNPVAICITFAYGIASGKRTTSRLKEVCDYWTKRVVV